MWPRWTRDTGKPMAMGNRELADDQKIARSLRRAWPAFLESFGRLKPIQRKTIPKVLEGKDVLVSSPTASGKTEAVCAPLIERFMPQKGDWTILYISPTRALVNDLYERLSEPTRRLGVKLVRRTGDHRDPLLTIPNVLITTPESFDSLLDRGTRKEPVGHVLANVVAIVLDEIHLLAGSARGEQLRWLIERLRRLRHQAMTKGWTRDESLQVLGLSATVLDRETTVKAFLPGGDVVKDDDPREIEVVESPSGQTVEESLPSYVGSLDDAEKILVFSNSRRRVDDLSAILRRRLDSAGYEVRAHHSSLDRRQREAVENAVKSGDKIIVVATSTLELGVDIGDIDLVVLDSPPPDVASLLQRIGRGNRRTDRTRVMACGASQAEMSIQEAMIAAARDRWLGPIEQGSHHAVIRQQIASYVFQSPRRTRTRALIEGLLDACSDTSIGRAVLDGMLAAGELVEDQAGIRLGQEWLDRAAAGEIHSNIDDPPGIEVVDSTTGEKYVKGIRSQRGEGLRAGGFPLQVQRTRGRTIEVQRVSDPERARGDWSYSSRPWLRGAAQPQCLRRYLGLDVGSWHVIREGGCAYAFHFGGAQRRAVIDILASDSGNADRVAGNHWYLRIDRVEDDKPGWLDDVSTFTVEGAIPERLPGLERILARPRANRSLPVGVRIDEVKSWLRVEEQIDWLNNAPWTVLEHRDDRSVLWEIVAAHKD